VSVVAIAFTSHVEPFTPPRGIKRKLNLDVSSDTIDRRLKEAGLYGRVARHLVTFNQNMDAKLLKKIFTEGHLLESAEDRGLMEPLGRQWWFLQDNDPKHKSREVQTWLHNKGIACIDFPPYSPDLNPIEHLWADLARRIEEHQDTTMEQLQDSLRVEAEWQATSVKFLRELVHSMPARCQAVIEVEGGHTKY
jgi:hypothetical protein